MNFDWDKYWWLVIIVAVLAGPFVQALFAPWRQYLRYRRQKDAIEALKVYAAQGKEPPADVMAALGGRRARWRAAAEGMAGVADAAAGVATDRWSRRAARAQYRADYWTAREPLRRWNWAIFAGAVTLGFTFAWQNSHANNDTYLIIAIIAGALTAAGVLTALLATFWRID